MQKKKKLSLLGFKPDWRYRAGISSVTTLEDCSDDIVARYIKAKLDGFSSDEEIFCVVDMSYEDRGLLEALYLGGASIQQISDITLTSPSVIQLALDLFFDVEEIRKVPLLRTQIAQKEKNRVVKSYKVFSAKYGWEEFLNQFLSKEEMENKKVTVPEAFTHLFNELHRKISELGMSDTGSNSSKELRSWMKLLLELTREMRENDSSNESDKNIDIRLIMEAMNTSKDSVKKDSFEFYPKLLKKEEETDEH